jgi:hypothetical protein
LKPLGEDSGRGFGPGGEGEWRALTGNRPGIVKLAHRSGNAIRTGPWRIRLECPEFPRKRQNRESLILGFILGSGFSLIGSFCNHRQIRELQRLERVKGIEASLQFASPSDPACANRAAEAGPCWNGVGNRTLGV